ncbi:MAG: hypothetical protein JO100_07170, partial [Pseudonocardia sp.]|nr:hypothetical protein [Pseudonocardia sp.]
AAPIITGTRLRRGGAGSAKGAASFVAENITAARAAEATGTLVARMDSAFSSYAVIGRPPAPRCALFDHHAPEPASESRDRDDRGVGVGADPLSERDLRRSIQAMDLATHTTRMIVRRVRRPVRVR